MDYIKAGRVVHYFDKIQVAVVEATDESIKIGNLIKIGDNGNLEQKVESIQVNHQPVEEIKIGEEAGLKVADAVNVGDIVYKAKD